MLLQLAPVAAAVAVRRRLTPALRLVAICFAVMFLVDAAGWWMAERYVSNLWVSNIGTPVQTVLLLFALAHWQTGLGKAESSAGLAAGIKVALYTTIFGLFVAIPATLLAAYLQARARRLAGAIAAVVAPAIEALAARPAVGAAPAAEGTHAA